MIGKEINIEKRNNIWDEIKKALVFAVQSAQGKYSLETYLEVLGEYTDQEIREFLCNGYAYGGGEVVFSTKKGEPTIKAVVKMYFMEKDSKAERLKKAERYLEKSIFTSEAIEEFEGKGEVAFEINAPEKG